MKLQFLKMLFLLSVTVTLAGCSQTESEPPQDSRWTALGPFGMEVQAIAVSPARPGRIYCAGDKGDVYRSDDGGESWQLAYALRAAVHAIAVHPGEEDVVYAGTDILGVQRSVDGGATWSKLDAGLEADPFVRALLIDVDEPDILYAGTLKSRGAGGVYRSLDAGKTWRGAESGLPAGSVIAIAQAKDRSRTLYAGAFGDSAGLYISTDRGSRWSRASRGLPAADIYDIVVHPTRPGIVYAATAAGVFRSENSAASWAPSSFGIKNLDVRSLAIDPATPRVLYAAGAAGIYKTRDGGSQWYEASRGLTNRLAVCLAIDPKRPEHVYVGTLGVSADAEKGSYLGGIFKSADAGQSWSPCSNGLTDLDVREVAFDAAGSDVMYAGTMGRGVFRSEDGGLTWSAAQEYRNIGLDSPDILALSADPKKPGVLLAASYSGGIYRTDDGGVKWRQTWGPGRVQVLRRHPMKSDTLYMAGFVGGVLRSDNGGGNWRQTGFSKNGIFALQLDPQNAEIIYVAVHATDGSGGVYKSVDGGQTWNPKSHGMENRWVRALAVDPHDPQILYAGTLAEKNPEAPAMFYSSRNGGETWSAMSPQSGQTFALLALPADETILYRGSMYDGVDVSYSRGASWQKINEGLRDLNILHLSISPFRNNRIYAGSVSGGIFVAEVDQPANPAELQDRGKKPLTLNASKAEPASGN